MRGERAGGLLLTLGLVVGAAAGIGLLLGFEPAQLPRELLNIAAYKLTFLAAGGLLAGGALLLRYGRRERPARDRGLGVEEPAGLGEGLPGEMGIDSKMPDRTAGRPD
jgi:hypothetical protein